jgi:hypothetical protein
MPCATLRSEPTETIIRLPSVLKTTSRVECPPSGSEAITVSGLPTDLVSPDV